MCVKFHDEEKRLEVNGGASCLYEEIQKCSIQNEDANFKGKTKPFTHTILGGATFMAGAVEPMMYVGIKVVLKDNSVLPIYVSKEKVLFNSDKYLNDVKEANAILKELEKDSLIIRKEYPQIPPKVEYSLSDRGKSLMEILDRLCVWGEIHKNDMK